ncbi:MAG: DUF948 domain-containing protein [Melioribacteraceae bacterium]|nr:DUF948 domain-containing protein [Melioribacteraceae bacterium]
MDLTDILLAILLIIASVLGLYLIKLVKRLFITIDLVEREIEELDSKITPLLYELREMTKSGNRVTTYVKEQADFLNSIVEKFKSKFNRFIPKKEENVSPQSNAHNLITNLKALFKGAATFINEIKK